jgi:iron(III) transport system permease protein
MFKKKNKFWFFIPFLISLLVLIPIIIIISSFFLNTSEYKAFLTKTYLFYYVSNSFILLTGVLFLTSLFGIGCAYFTTFYKFPGSSFFSWALIMGFGIPGYIYAYSLNAFF